MPPARKPSTTGQRFFSPQIAATDSLYSDIRCPNEDYAHDAHTLVESLWQVAAQYVDADIQSKAAISFHPHFWELYLASYLLRGGLRLVPRSRRGLRDRGPDLQMEQPTVWIEAVAAMPGAGPDVEVGRALLEMLLIRNQAMHGGLGLFARQELFGLIEALLRGAVLCWKRARQLGWA